MVSSFYEKGKELERKKNFLMTFFFLRRVTRNRDRLREICQNILSSFHTNTDIPDGPFGRNKQGRMFKQVESSKRLKVKGPKGLKF